MELHKFETTMPEFEWATLGKFSLPHIKVRLVFTSNWEKQFTLFVTEWNKPQKEQSYSFNTYQEAFDMFALVNNTNRVALDEIPEITEAPDNVEDYLTSEQKKEMRELFEKELV